MSEEVVLEMSPHLRAQGESLTARIAVVVGRRRRAMMGRMVENEIGKCMLSCYGNGWGMVKANGYR